MPWLQRLRPHTSTPPPRPRLHAPVIDWFTDHARDLPWRRPEAGAWGVMVSEFMLQQTPVSRVLPVYEQWLARWPRPADLAAEAPGEAVRAWGRLGYPRRALRLHGAAAGHNGAARRRRAHRARRSCSRCPGSASTRPPRWPPSRTGSGTPCWTPMSGGSSPVRSPASQYPPNATTAAERKLARALLPEDDRHGGALGRGLDGAGRAGLHGQERRTCGRCPIAGAVRLAAGRASPRTTGPPRRGQTYAGTDRQVRGKLLAVLREAVGAGAAAGTRRGVARAGTAGPGAGRARRRRSGRAPGGWGVPAAADVTARTTAFVLNPSRRSYPVAPLHNRWTAVRLPTAAPHSAVTTPP